MVGYTYATWKSALAQMMVVEEDNTEFLAILPSIRDYAEQRCYRELDLLDTVVRDTSGTLTANNRYFNLPTTQGTFVVVNGANVITPAGTAASTGTRNKLTPVSPDVMDMLWPSATSNTGLPQVFAMNDQGQIIVGPSPDDSYFMEIVGTIRPTPLSEDNTTTFLSQYLPDLFLAASMVFASGYQRNFGSQADDPKMSASWEAQYQTLLASAVKEEVRKKMWAEAWGPMSSSPSATPARV